MPQRSLTDRFCQHAKARAGEAQTDWFDEDTLGLALRVTNKGSKSWTWLFTWGGKRVRMTFGTYPTISLARARTKADEAKAQLADGHDPRAALAKPDTLQAVCEDWGHHEAGKLRTGKDRMAALQRLVYPAFGNRPIADVRRGDIIRLLDQIAKERGQVMAIRTHAILRALLNWYQIRNEGYHSPIVRGMIREGRNARDRILSDDEIRKVWATAEGQGAFGRMVQFLLLTGARRTEAAQMQWSELDLATGDWLLPAQRNKTGVELCRPLSKQALAVLPERGAGAWVFTNDSIRALRGFGELKAAFDRATGPMEPWRLHDLRRTSRSLMSRAGVPSDHGERCLGHVIGGIRGIYDRHSYYEEKRDALAALARLIDRIVQGKPTLVRLRRREAGADV